MRWWLALGGVAALVWLSAELERPLANPFPARQRRRKRASYANPTRWYHGSPYGGADDFLGFRAPLFLTRNEKVGRQYATMTLLAAGKDPKTGKPKKATVYEVDLDDDVRTFDVRRPEHAALYEQLRKARLASGTVDDEDRWMYPRLSAPHVLQSGSGLPNFGLVGSIVGLLRDAGAPFDAALFDEGTQGISLALWDLARASIVGKIFP